MSAMLDSLLKREWSERQQVAAIIGAAGLLILALWFLLLAPMNIKRRELEGRIAGMRDQLAQRDALIGEDALDARRRQAQEDFRRIFDEWTATTGRLLPSDVTPGEAPVPVAAIDYKVALFEVRDRLQGRARQQRMNLPRDLGLADEVGVGEDPGLLMQQLRAIEHLADLFLDLRIGAVRTIEPLPPRQLHLPDEGPVFAQEYPVRVEFYGNLEHLYRLLQEAFRRQPVFAVRRAQVGEVDQSRPDLLRMDVEFCTLVFVGDPAALTTPPRAPAPARRPMGI